LAVTNPTRYRFLPNVPTFAELGYPDFTAKVWFGLFVRKGTPAALIQRYTDAAKVAHNDADVKKKLEAQGFEVVGETGPQLIPDIKQQIARWAKLVKASGFSAEDRGSTR
jgi:tripartite-type tricarboxylate transporter receptor subunit TctC